MVKSFFVSDIHGNKNRYKSLFEKIIEEKPKVVFFGGDLYPSYKEIKISTESFFEDYFFPLFQNLKDGLGDSYPKFFIILGNDDPRTEEYKFQSEEAQKYWTYLNSSHDTFDGFNIIGYPYIPPTPFLYKDWELYDVSRYVDPGCIHPIKGKRFVDPQRDIEYTTIKKDLEKLSENLDVKKSVFLFHSPPYQTKLDRAGLDDMYFDHVPLDVNIGSVAIKEFIENEHPHLTMHGHVHESTRITGEWKDTIGNSISFNAATDENRLSLIIFDLKNTNNAKRQII